MILNETFKSIGDYFNYEEKYVDDFSFESDRIMYRDWFGVEVDRVLFTTSDDDYDFITKVLDYMETATPIKVINFERFYIVNGEFKFTYTYHEGGLCEVKFAEGDRELVDKFFK
jgi:hypothetical protein